MKFNCIFFSWLVNKVRWKINIQDRLWVCVALRTDVSTRMRISHITHYKCRYHTSAHAHAGITHQPTHMQVSHISQHTSIYHTSVHTHAGITHQSTHMQVSLISPHICRYHTSVCRGTIKDLKFLKETCWLFMIYTMHQSRKF